MSLFKRLISKANKVPEPSEEKYHAVEGLTREKVIDDSASTAPLLLESIDSTFLSSLPTVQALFALTKESPTARTCYEQDKKAILIAVLQNELLPQQLSMAFDCLEAPSVRQGVGAKPAIEKFLAALSYCNTQLSPPLEDRPLQEIEKLARLQETVTAITQVFCTEASENWPSSGQPGPKLEHLSDTERIRLYRAFYLHELFCRLFSLDEPGKSTSVFRKEKDMFNSQGHAEKFLAVFPPWEVEEMTCVYEFTLRQYRPMMRRINAYIQKHPTRAIREPCPSDDSDDDYAEDAIFYKENIHGFASYGLEFLRKALEVSGNVKRLRAHLGFNNRVVILLSLQDALEAGPFRAFLPPEYFVRQFPEEDSPLPFMGDDPDQPSAGWTLVNNEKMSFYCGEAVFQELREWEFVFWDNTTLKAGQALDEIRKAAAASS